MLLVQRLKQSIEKSSFAVFEINFDFVHLLNVNFSLYDKRICLYNDLKCQEKWIVVHFILLEYSLW